MQSYTRSYEFKLPKLLNLTSYFIAAVVYPAMILGILVPRIIDITISNKWRTLEF